MRLRLQHKIAVRVGYRNANKPDTHHYRAHHEELHRKIENRITVREARGRGYTIWTSTGHRIGN